MEILFILAALPPLIACCAFFAKAPAWLRAFALLVVFVIGLAFGWHAYVFPSPGFVAAALLIAPLTVAVGSTGIIDFALWYTGTGVILGGVLALFICCKLWGVWRPWQITTAVFFAATSSGLAGLCMEGVAQNNRIQESALAFNPTAPIHRRPFRSSLKDVALNWDSPLSAHASVRVDGTTYIWSYRETAFVVFDP